MQRSGSLSHRKGPVYCIKISMNVITYFLRLLKEFGQVDIACQQHAPDKLIFLAFFNKFFLYIFRLNVQYSVQFYLFITQGYKYYEFCILV